MEERTEKMVGTWPHMRGGKGRSRGSFRFLVFMALDHQNEKQGSGPHLGEDRVPPSAIHRERTLENCS